MGAADEEFLKLVRDGGRDGVSESLLGELVSVDGDDLKGQQ